MFYNIYKNVIKCNKDNDIFILICRNKFTNTYIYNTYIYIIQFLILLFLLYSIV